MSPLLKDRQTVLFANDGRDDNKSARLLVVHGNWDWKEFVGHVKRKFAQSVPDDQVKFYLAPHGVPVLKIDEFVHNSKLWVDFSGRPWFKPSNSNTVDPSNTSGFSGRALRMLIPFDSSTSSLVALRHGLHLAKTLQADLTLLHALDNEITLAWEGDNQFIIDSLKEKAEAVLAKGKEIASAAGVPCRTLAPIASPAAAVMEHGAWHDIVVMGTHGKKGFKRGLLGSVAENVLRHAHFPIIFVHAKKEDANNDLSTDWTKPVYERVFVAWDDSPYAEQALRGVMPLVAALECDLTLGYVENPNLELDSLDKMYISGLTQQEQVNHHAREKLKVGVKIATDNGPFSLPQDKVHVLPIFSPEQKKTDKAKKLLAAIDEGKFDLVVMGTHGRSGLTRLVMGSVTEYVMRHTNVPVMAVGDRRYFAGHGI